MCIWAMRVSVLHFLAQTDQGLGLWSRGWLNSHPHCLLPHRVGGGWTGYEGDGHVSTTNSLQCIINVWLPFLLNGPRSPPSSLNLKPLRITYTLPTPPASHPWQLPRSVISTSWISNLCGSLQPHCYRSAHRHPLLPWPLTNLFACAFFSHPSLEIINIVNPAV